MSGLWTLECPNEGIFQGKCHVAKKGKTFVLHCPKGVTKFKNPNADTCESGSVVSNDINHKFLPKTLSKCERANSGVQRTLSRCIQALEKRGDKNAVKECRASIKCPL